jgi:hypothetical protein
MELLRFDDAGSTTPQRKKSSRGMLAVGLVATLFGISSAFATTTVSINSNQGVSLGQGVTLAAACDTAISVVPVTSMTVEGDLPTFYLTKIQFKGIDVDTGDPTASPATYGCGGKTFDVQIFNPSTSLPYGCLTLEGFGRAVAYDGAYGAGGVEVSTGCAGNTLSFGITTALSGDKDYEVIFTKAPSDISYITLVTRES